MLPVVGEIGRRQAGVRRAHAAELEAQLAPFALERVFAAQVDAAARRVGIHARRRCVVELDRFDAGDRHLLERVLAAVVVVRGRRRHACAIGGERRVFGIEPADAHRGRIHLGIVERQARHVLHELADIAHGEPAIIVSGDHRLSVHRRATLHDRSRLAVARGSDRHRLHLAAAIGRKGLRLQCDLQCRHLPGGYDRRSPRFLQAGIAHDDGDLPGGKARQTEIATLIRIGDDRRALGADFGVAHIFAGGGVEHPPGKHPLPDHPPRLRRGRRACRAQSYHLPIVAGDLERRAGDQTPERCACVHPPLDRWRAHPSKVAGRCNDLQLGLACECRNGLDRRLCGKVEAALLRESRRRGDDGGDRRARQDRIADEHVLPLLLAAVAARFGG